MEPKPSEERRETAGERIQGTETKLASVLKKLELLKSTGASESELSSIARHNEGNMAIGINNMLEETENEDEKVALTALLDKIYTVFKPYLAENTADDMQDTIARLLAERGE